MVGPSALPPAPHLTLASSVARIFDLSLGQMLWSRRSLFLAVLATGPVSLGLLLRLVSASPIGPPRMRGTLLDGEMLFGLIVWLLYIRFIVPALGVFYGTALIADEIEDKTITYLLTRPIHRASILIGKYAAYVTCTLLIVLPSLIGVYFLVVPIGRGHIGHAFPQLMADLAIVAAGLAAYGAVFGFVGARFKRPLIAGLVFAFGWEPTVLLIPGYLRRLTVGYYLQGLVPHTMPDQSATSVIVLAVTERPPAWISIATLVLVTLGTLWLAGRATATRDYVLER